MTIKEFDKLLDSFDITPILNSRVRQVRWLYKNNNKCTKVFDEKMVRLIVHRLQEKIKELEYFTDILLENTEMGLRDEGIFFGDKLRKLGMEEYNILKNQYDNTSIS